MNSLAESVYSNKLNIVSLYCLSCFSHFSAPVCQEGFLTCSGRSSGTVAATWSLG